MGANWCNTLDHYRILAPELRLENLEIYAFEAAPYIQPFVDKCVLAKNRGGPMPDLHLLKSYEGWRCVWNVLRTFFLIVTTPFQFLALCSFNRQYFLLLFCHTFPCAL